MAEHMDEDSTLDFTDDFIEINEGKARILFPKLNTVFYNNVQVFNRDLSVAVIKLFIKKFRVEKASIPQQNENTEVIPEKNVCSENKTKARKKTIKILEALSATGLRATRYALEIPHVDKIIANDLSDEAVQSIKRNISHNNVEHIVESSKADASLIMYENRFPYSKRFQVIDLDPYGSPCQFLDGAVQAIDDGGLLCITCTDMAGLCGNHGEASFAKYGSMPLKSKYCHEMALRIVLSSVDLHANRYKRYIVPLLSISADFYIRIYVLVNTGASEVKRSASKRSYVFHCGGCDTFHLQPVGKSVENGPSRKYNPATGPVVPQKCADCGNAFKIGGPIWSQPMHDSEFVNGLLADIKTERECYSTFPRMQGTLSVVSEELHNHPLYFVLDHLCNILHSTTPSHAQFRSALLHAGYKSSSTHANQAGIKTDAPVSVVWDILRSWVKLHSVNPKKLTARSPATVILSKEAEFTANFDVVPEATSRSKKSKLARFPVNPEVDWGPKAKAKQNNEYKSLAEKRKCLQGKRKKGTVDSAFKKNFQCKKFKQGKCGRGDDCHYSHEESATTERNDDTKD